MDYCRLGCNEKSREMSDAVTRLRDKREAPAGPKEPKTECVPIC